MSRGHQPLDEAEGFITTIFSIVRFGFPCVYSHANADRDLSPGFTLQILLCLMRGFEGVTCFMERGTKPIANDLKDHAMIGFNCSPQDDMMACARYFPCFGMLSCQFHTAFNIREEASHRASWDIPTGTVTFLFTDIEG